MTNNVKVDQGSGDGAVIVAGRGNSFRRFGTYSANSGRRYVALNCSEAHWLNMSPVKNYYMDSTEWSSTTVGNMITGACIGSCRFNGTISSLTLVTGFGVASITKNGTGDYTVTLLRPTGVGAKHAHFLTNGAACTFQLFGEGTDYIRFGVFSDGAPYDAGAVTVTIFEG